MGLIKLLAAPIRSLVRFPLFQLAVVVAVIMFLQAADDRSAFGQIFLAYPVRCHSCCRVGPVTAVEIFVRRS